MPSTSTLIVPSACMTNVQVYPSCSVTVAVEPFCTQVQASDSSPSQIVPVPPALKVTVICAPMAAGSMVWPFAEAFVSTHWPSKLPVAGAVPPVEGSRPSGSSPPPGAFRRLRRGCGLRKVHGHAVHHGQQRAVRLERERRDLFRDLTGNRDRVAVLRPRPRSLP